MIITFQNFKKVQYIRN